MSRILIVTWDGGGNVPPAMAIGGVLARRGHDVLVLGHAGNRAHAERSGLQFAEFASAADFRGVAFNSPPTLLSMFSSRAMADDASSVAASFAADLVVVDCLLVTVADRLAAERVRYVLLEHLFDAYLRTGWWRGPIGLGLRCKGFRLSDISDNAARCIVAVLPELDPGAVRRHAGVDYVGPALDRTADGVGADRRDGRPKVLVSLSTFGFRRMDSVYQRVIDAVAQLPIDAVVTTGPVVDPASLHSVSNVEIHRFVPHAELLPTMSLVIGHGGHSTTMAALAYDVPLVMMPMSRFLDQPMVASSVERAGAGRQVMRSTSAHRLREAIESVLDDTAISASAAALGRRIRELDGANRAADIVERAINGAQASGSRTG